MELFDLISRCLGLLGVVLGVIFYIIDCFDERSLVSISPVELILGSLILLNS